MSQTAYTLFSQTSAAAPHVAGVAALLLSVNPALTRDQVYEALLETADPTGCPIDPNIPDDQECGRGVVDAYAALQYVLETFGGHLARGLTIPAGETWTPGAVTWTFGPGQGLTVRGTLAAAGTTFEGDGGTWRGLRADGGTATLTGVTVADVSRCATPPQCAYEPERAVVEAVGRATVTITAGSTLEGGEAANGVLALGTGSLVTVSGQSQITDHDGYGAFALGGGRVEIAGDGTVLSGNTLGGVLADGHRSRVLIEDQAAVELNEGYGATARNLGRVTVEPTAQVGNTRLAENEGGLVAESGGFVDAGDCLLADCGDRGQPNDLQENDPDGPSPPQDSPTYTRDARAVGGSTVTALYGFWGAGQTTPADLDLFDDASSAVYVSPLASSLSGGASLRGGASGSSGSQKSSSGAFGSDALATDGPIGLAAEARRLAALGDTEAAWAALAQAAAVLSGEAEREAVFHAAASFAGDLPAAALAALRAQADGGGAASPWAARVLAVAGEAGYADALVALGPGADGHAAFGHLTHVAHAVGAGDAQAARARLAAFEAAFGKAPTETDAARLQAAARLVAVAFPEAEDAPGVESPSLPQAAVAAKGDLAEGPALRASPNPARRRATVTLRAGAGWDGTVAVFDALGRRVHQLHVGELTEGAHAFELDASRLAPGVYAVVARGTDAAGPNLDTTRLTVVR